jgi:outer membrane protein assembly factor BamB
MALIIPLMTLVAQAADPQFGNPLFANKWIEQDRLVGSQGITRPYTWGPSVPEAPTARLEPYNSSPGGQRQVQYFDKARMEINDPSKGIVTAGLAVKELVSGLRQDGDTTFTPLQPSKTQVAGDAVSVNPNAPVYASFTNVVTLGGVDSRSKPNAVGSSINAFIAKDGTVSTVTAPENIIVGAFEANTGHNIAKPFFDFMNQTGPITDPISGNRVENQKIYTNDPTTNVFGLAISEPYWVSTKVAGVDRLVLVQLFERRVLTYNPALTSSKVEMGNLGQHYYQWRYVESQTTTPPPTTTPTTPPTTSAPLDFSQLRASFLKTGNVPSGNTGGATGNMLSYPTGAPASNSSPVYDPDKKLAIVGTGGGGVVAVDLSNFGTPVQKWKFTAGSANFNSNVILSNGIVYIGAGDSKVYAINESDGTLAWQSSAAGGAITTDVMVDNDSVYFVAGDGKIYAVTRSAGTPRWQTQPSGVNLTTAPIQDSNGILYVGGADNKLYAFNKDGTQVSSGTFTPTLLDGAISARPSFGNGHLYVGTSNGTLYALNSNGTIQTQRTFTAGKGIYTTPAIVTVAGSVRVYVGTDDGKVYGVDGNNLSIDRFSFNVPGAPVVRSSVAVVDNFIYFGAEDKNIYRVEANNSSNSLVIATADSTFGQIAPVVNSGYLAIVSQVGTLYAVK